MGIRHAKPYTLRGGPSTKLGQRLFKAWQLNIHKKNSSISSKPDRAHICTISIQSTSLSDDKYEFEGEDIESFGQLFGWSPEPAADKVVNYDYLSIDNFVFIANLNKIHEPTTYLEAFKDSRWVDAINQKMGAFNRNKTWEIVDLPSNRKPLAALKKWNEKLVSVLSDNGFVQSKLKYFLRIEVLDVDDGICLTQRKYYTELLYEFRMLACKPCNTPIEANPENKEVISKFGNDEVLTVHCLSHVMHSPMKSHLRLAFRVLRYLKKEPCLGITFRKSPVFSERVRRQDVVPNSSTERLRYSGNVEMCKAYGGVLDDKLSKHIGQCFAMAHLLAFGGSTRGLQSPSLYLWAYFNIRLSCSGHTARSDSSVCCKIQRIYRFRSKKKDFGALFPVMEAEPYLKSIADKVCKGAASITEP
ncbi:hypothetical protein Tco_0335464, partial [Tanacetum coccineum]